MADKDAEPDVEKAMEEVEKAFKALPCQRIISIPIGVSLIAIVSLPVQFFMFVWLGVTAGLVLVWKLTAMNFEKMGEHSRNAFRKAEGFGACLPFLNGYTCNFLLTCLLCLAAIPGFLILYPLYGAGHAVIISARWCFIESDMAEEARPDKGGWISNLIDRAGISDTDKEKLAEKIGEGYCGYMFLVLCDWLTLTGVIEGFKTFTEGFEFHKGILETLQSLMTGFSWMEGLGIKDWVEVDVVPLHSLRYAMKKAIEMQYDAYAIEKKFASFTEFSQKNSLKKYRGCFGTFYAVVGLLIAIGFWSGIGAVAS